MRIAPRAGIAWTPFGNQRTVIRGGYGQFYDHIPLDVYAFSRYPEQTITMYTPLARRREYLDEYLPNPSST